MRGFGEDSFETENSGHSAFNEVTDESDFGAVPENGLKTAELVFAFGCFVDREVEELE
jgi:hypothetical protein